MTLDQIIDIIKEWKIQYAEKELYYFKRYNEESYEDASLWDMYVAYSDFSHTLGITLSMLEGVYSAEDNNEHNAEVNI